MLRFVMEKKTKTKENLNFLCYVSLVLLIEKLLQLAMHEQLGINKGIFLDKQNKKRWGLLPWRSLFYKHLFNPRKWSCDSQKLNVLMSFINHNHIRFHMIYVAFACPLRFRKVSLMQSITSLNTLLGYQTIV